MALPIDLNTLDYTYLGMPFCQGPSKSSDVLNTMDVDYQGAPFLANDTSQASSSQAFGLDRKYKGVPFVEAANLDFNLYTLDYKEQGVPYVSNILGGDITFAAGANTIQVSAPTVKTNGLNRTFPLKRSEEIDSNSPLAHIFPYVAVQDPQLIP